eukprot:7233412-Pyramimonas_sp.AAC.1
MGVGVVMSSRSSRELAGASRWCSPGAFPSAPHLCWHSPLQHIAPASEFSAPAMAAMPRLCYVLPLAIGAICG